MNHNTRRLEKDCIGNVVSFFARYIESLLVTDLTVLSHLELSHEHRFTKHFCKPLMSLVMIFGGDEQAVGAISGDALSEGVNSGVTNYVFSVSVVCRLGKHYSVTVYANFHGLKAFFVTY